jgi:diadenosine tetraphosphate (Ap4A) HIT family hydrolase
MGAGIVKCAHRRALARPMWHLAFMSARLGWIEIVIAVATTSGLARADGPAPDRRALMREFRALAEERDKVVREKGEIFANIAVRRDYRSEYVLFRDDDVTAFLDLTDPQHPRYSPKSGGGDEGARVDPKRRAHILVVPNRPREHIGKTLTSDIAAEDLEATLQVVRAAEVLAKRLRIANPQIYLKSSELVGIGYLHVHIVGERDPSVPYPPPLKP